MYLKYSFILPAYKGRFLQEAIASVLAQTYRDFELVIVDDCSQDDLIGIVNGFRDDRIRYYRNEYNIGGDNLVDQWNKCLELAQGEYVILATDDDLYEPCFLEEMNNLAIKYPSVDIFRARILQVDGVNRIFDIDKCYTERMSLEEFVYHLFHGMRGGIPHYVMRRTTLQIKGGYVKFPKAWASDDATAIMMAENGIACSQHHLVRFRWSDINISSDINCITEKIKARLLYYRWLKVHIPNISSETEMGRFLHKGVNDYLPIYNKVALLSHLKGIPFLKKLQCLKMIWKDKEIDKKDKYSIILRSI